MTEHDDHDDCGGLHRDLRATGAAMNRRRWIRLASSLGLAGSAFPLLACGDGESHTAPSTAGTGTGGTGTGTGTGAGTCPRIPEETAGPFPGDGSNGTTVLNAGGVVRTDIRSSFAGLSGTADGIPLTLTLTIVSASTCVPLAGRAVYLWHCDRLGYPGRWPHIHFEVFPGLASAASVANKVATSQVALPKSSCDEVYATTGYESGVRNLAGVSLATDNVFSDGSALELATVMGSVQGGYLAALSVAV